MYIQSASTQCKKLSRCHCMSIIFWNIKARRGQTGSCQNVVRVNPLEMVSKRRSVANCQSFSSLNRIHQCACDCFGCRCGTSAEMKPWWLQVPPFLVLLANLTLQDNPAPSPVLGKGRFGRLQTLLQVFQVIKFSVCLQCVTICSGTPPASRLVCVRETLRPRNFRQ